MILYFSFLEKVDLRQLHIAFILLLKQVLEKLISLLQKAVNIFDCSSIKILLLSLQQLLFVNRVDMTFYQVLLSLICLFILFSQWLGYQIEFNHLLYPLLPFCPFMYVEGGIPFQVVTGTAKKIKLRY